jgi:hypothetical protein
MPEINLEVSVEDLVRIARGVPLVFTADTGEMIQIKCPNPVAPEKIVLYA